MARRGLAIPAAALVAVIVLLFARALMLKPFVQDRGVEVVFGEPPIDTLQATESLAAAIRFRTVSTDNAPPDTAVFRALHAWMEARYPLVHERLVRETPGELSLLYTWGGADPSLDPAVLLGHLDVVPPDSAGTWTHPPFEGRITAGHVWGRGSIDNKSTVVGIMEATESLLATGFSPDRTLMFAFGHDEEIGGDDGAGTIASLLESRGVRAAALLDEGGFVTHGTVPGVKVPVAVVGVAEKGNLNLRIQATATGGHSSVPPAQTAIGSLSRALARIEEHPMPAHLDGATWGLLRTSAPYMSFPLRLVFANKWLFRPLIVSQLASRATTNATIRTSQALTVIDGGSKSNVLPDRASAVVNFRLYPGDTADWVTSRIRQVANDPAISVTRIDAAREASTISPDSGWAFEAVASSIRASFHYGEMVIAPYLVVGGTDARHYGKVTDFAYRFQPVEIDPETGILLHATDERLPVSSMAAGVGFYRRVIQAFGSSRDSEPAES